MSELEAFTACGEVTAKVNTDLRLLSSKLDVMLDNVDKTSAVLGNWLAVWSQVNQQQAEVKKGAPSAPGASAAGGAAQQQKQQQQLQSSKPPR